MNCTNLRNKVSTNADEIDWWIKYYPTIELVEKELKTYEESQQKLNNGKFRPCHCGCWNAIDEQVAIDHDVWMLERVAKFHRSKNGL